jgi:Flp pilus assembly protein TadD
MYAPAEGGPRERAREFLKAVELKPGDPVIAYNAGLGLAAAGDCEAALPHLLKLPSITPEQAPDYLRVVAICAHNTGQDARAQVAAKQLRSLARTPQQEEAAEALLRMVSEPLPRPGPNPR